MSSRNSLTLIKQEMLINQDTCYLIINILECLVFTSLSILTIRKFYQYLDKRNIRKICCLELALIIRLVLTIYIRTIDLNHMSSINNENYMKATIINHI